MREIIFKFKKIIPKKFFSLYHYFLSFVFALYNGFPSKKIVVIGITGTKGKSTVSYLIYYLLKNLGIKTALSSSVFCLIDDKKIENKDRVTMPGRGFLQRFLKEAIDNKCEVAVLEISSEGLAQLRHSFIDFDIALFLNLHPEHIESHGSYENYRKAKGKLFKALEKSKERKYLRGMKIKKTIIVNADDFEADYYLSFRAEQKITFGLESNLIDSQFSLKPSNYKVSNKGIEFTLDGKKFYSPLLGKFNLYNLLAGISVIKALNLSINNLDTAIKEFKGLPGRMEIINAKGFKIVVDYAHTPHSIEEVYKSTLELLKPKRMLCLIGSAGSRDKWKRPVIGEIAAKYCHYLVISDEDPFEEDSEEILKAVEMGAKRYLAEYEIEKPIEVIPDRKKAIYRLIEIATRGDVIVSVGKGNEPSIVYKDKVIAWNEKEVFISALKNYSKISTKTL
jgi:UDP-N-acetylmuramoyl-L-alanyl-D-glutamate--2,6-diaminopimelate ligase